MLMYVCVYLAVPQVKRNLEAMLFKVKALTEAMGCLGSTHTHAHMVFLLKARASHYLT